MLTGYRRWTQHPYQGELLPPVGAPEAGFWPMFFFSRGADQYFYGPFHDRINLFIKNPYYIDWQAELLNVEQTLRSLTPQQVYIAQYWATGELTEKISTMIFSLAAKYRLGSPYVARVLGYVYAAMNDTFVITWYLKYLWDVARPNQYNRNLPKVLDTPRFPAYPSAHATVAGCAEILLRFFFPQDAYQIGLIMQQSAQSRLYAGVHFNIDNVEGMKLGRQIGEIVVHFLRTQNLIV